MTRLLASLVSLGSLLALGAEAHAQSVLFDLAGDSANDSFGQVVDVLGDVNGDGLADVMVGAWRDGAADAGAVYVYSGADGSLLRRIQGLGGGDHLGFGSSAAGDVDGDGLVDVIAAADEDDLPGMSNAGSARIMSVVSGQVIRTHEGTQSGALFGWSTAALGDCDGDGRDDYAISALRESNAAGTPNAGSVRVYSGATGQQLHVFFGLNVNNVLGAEVAPAGDVNIVMYYWE